MNSRINFIFNHGFEIVQVQSAMHCTTCTIGIRCHVSANGSVVPSLVLRYWRDRRIGKGTYVLLLLLNYTYSHPAFGFATAHAQSTSRFASAQTHRALWYRLHCRCVANTVRCRCVSYSASTPLSLPYRHVCLGPTQDTRGRIPESLYHPIPYLPFPPRFPTPYHRHPGTV